MGDEGWRGAGVSAFLSERARSRAPQILSFAAVTGAAMLVSPQGKIVLSSGAAADLDRDRLARIARARGGAVALASFTSGTTCVHAAPVCRGWMLCILSTVGVYPAVVIERLQRASAVMALALVDPPGAPPEGRGSGGEGAPAEVYFRRRK